MPVYDFRCKNCGEEFETFYKTLADYEAATPHCPNCDAVDLARVITSVQVHSSSHDYSRMNAKEMLSVLEGGDSQHVSEMYRQVGAATPDGALGLHDIAQKAGKKKKKDPSGDSE